MNNLKDYFYTDWGAMTQHDWVGLIMTIVVFFVMLGLYAYVFHPANKERFEAQRNIPLEDESDFQDHDFSKQNSNHNPKHSPKHLPNTKKMEEQK